ncbi:HvfC/BufC family peptide modification chaperone [Maritalea sp.]|uniref:HvfC/BufC family peptide modification chaperone n=1 Tax=Maritalea sp. TaxID=2003361 RepID=UPI003EFAC07C
MQQNNTSFSQTEFASSLFNAEAPLPAGIVNPDGIAAPKRFSVYKNNVIVSYLEALAAAYPACKNLVGEEFFNAIGHTYLSEVPPDSQLMILFGKGFAEFLLEYPPAQQIPFLPDIARLERAWRLAYHSADTYPITPEKLAVLPQDQLGEATIEFLPSFAIVASNFPVFSIWDAASNMQPLDDVDPTQSQAAIIVRPEIDVLVHLLPAQFIEPINALKSGKTIGESAEIGLNNDDSFDFSGLFTLLIQTGSIAEIKISNGGK